MKSEKYFFSIMITLLLVTFAQAASAAYMKYTYQTPMMQFISEQTYNEDGVLSQTELFWGTKEQIDIVMIIPEIEIELEEMEVFYEVYENPVVSITGSNFLNTITINSSKFIFETWKVEGQVYQDWWLYFDITDTNFPNNLERRASFRSTGWSSYMTLYQDNFFYRRCAGQYPPEWNMGCIEGVYDSVVKYEGEYTGEYLDEYPGGIYRLFGEYIPVSEPLSPILLLTGLAGMLLTRRIKFKNR